MPHAGEWAGPCNVLETLEHYLPDRIGHGVCAVEDPALVARLAATGIPLEASPMSNVATGVYPSLAEHPFRVLRDGAGDVGVRRRRPGRDARTGVRASFADDDLKRRLLGDIDAWLREPIDPATVP